MTELLLALLLALSGTLLVDGLAHPRRAARRVFPRVGAGILLLFLLTLTAFGLLLGLSGNPLLAAILTLALHLLLVVASNAKRRMLGEPLLFSDLALVGAVFRHPQFYFSALATWQKVIGLIVAAVLAAALVWFFELAPSMHFAGTLLGAIALFTLGLSLRLRSIRTVAWQPQAEADVAALGLLPTLLLYWLRWREDGDQSANVTGAYAAPRTNAGSSFTRDETPEIIVTVQCESFADPVELFANPAYALPDLSSARADAQQWGNLLVSGFGAYTMRTEYGVLFGREEKALGFRRYDPFLTAMDDAGLAMPHSLGTDRWRSVFVHPHDMRFYNRHRILPAAGFAQLVNESAFAPPAPAEGRYVSDAAVAAKILELAGAASSPAFIYAVTIENHGPWSKNSSGEDGAGVEALLRNYNRMVGASDAMLGDLRKGIAELKKPAMLVFFGDHRPSIPDLSEPGGDRHTPYVILRFDAQGQIARGGNRREDITPAQLHHVILECGLGSHVSR